MTKCLAEYASLFYHATTSFGYQASYADNTDQEIFECLTCKPKPKLSLSARKPSARNKLQLNKRPF